MDLNDGGTKPTSLPLSRKPWEQDNEWAAKLEPYAIGPFYNLAWPNCTITALDGQRGNELAKTLDVGGADKMIRYKDGGLAFLGQRFRRYSQKRYDDFTLRLSRPSGRSTEMSKILLALERGGFIAGYYAYGLANEAENGFVRMRILRFREVIEAIISGALEPSVETNKDNSSDFIAIPFYLIPKQLFIVNYSEISVCDYADVKHNPPWENCLPCPLYKDGHCYSQNAKIQRRINKSED